MLAASFKKYPAKDAYVPWNESHSLTKSQVAEHGKLKSLDQIFTDESVANILLHIIFPVTLRIDMYINI